MDDNFSQWLNAHFDHLRALLGDNASCFIQNKVEPEELESDYRRTSGITKVAECEVHTGKGRSMDDDQSNHGDDDCDGTSKAYRGKFACSNQQIDAHKQKCDGDGDAYWGNFAQGDPKPNDHQNND